MHYWAFNHKDWLYNCRLYDIRGKYAYVAMLALYMDRESPLPLEVQEIARQIEMPGETELVDQILRDHYKQTKKGYAMAYAEELLGKIEKKRERAQAAADKASKAARDKRSQRSDIGSEIGSEIGSNVETEIGSEIGSYPITQIPNNPITQKPINPETQENINARERAADKPLNSPSPKVKKLTTTIERPDGCDEVVWADWLRVRGKNPLTQTAWAGMTSEASKAGISPAEAVRICAERGWRGFRADWLANDKAKRNGRYEPEDLSKQDYRSHDGEKFVAGSAAEYFYGKDYVRRARERYEKPYDRSKEELA